MLRGPHGGNEFHPFPPVFNSFGTRNLAVTVRERPTRWFGKGEKVLFRLVGIISVKDMLRFISDKVELEAVKRNPPGSPEEKWLFPGPSEGQNETEKNLDRRG